jgi:IS5 family transposase
MLKKHVLKPTFFDDYIWQNFIPKDHKLVKIKEFLDLDFIDPLVKDAYNNENRTGRNPIDPKILFMVCLLEHFENLSDVEAAKKIYEVPLYRYFIGLGPEDNIPDDSTISYFRTQRMGEKKFKEAFNKIINQLFEAGLIDGKIQSQDATDMRGDIAILDVFGLLNKCRENVLRALKRLDNNLYERWVKEYDFKVAVNPRDKQKHFEELIIVCQKLYQESLKHRKLLKDKKFHHEIIILNRAISERKDEYFDKEGKKQKKKEERITGKMINPSDTDVSWGAKSDKNYFAGYKVESNLDHKYGIITAVEVEKAGHGEEKAASLLLKQQKENINITPEHFVADAKYDYGDTRVELRSIGAKNLYIPLVPTKHKEKGFKLDEFEFKEGNLICPAGYCSEGFCINESKLGFEFRFNKKVCAICKLRKECTTAKTSGRRVLIVSSQLERKASISFNAADEYGIVMRAERYKIEPRQADLKRNHGLKRARYRGLCRVRIQTYLAVIASNLKKWFKYTIGKLKDGTEKTLSQLAALGTARLKVCQETS